MRRAWATLVSMRTAAWLLAALAALLLLAVLLPQADSSPAAHRQLLEGGGAPAFLLEDLGLGRVGTSPPFLALLALSLLSLAAVLIDRAGATLRRLRARPPAPAALAEWLARPDATELPAPGLDGALAATVLARLGYRAAAPGPGTLWGVKHRAAILGFPLFHASFFLLAAGGVLLFLTRHVASVALTEGEPFAPGRAAVSRRAPLGSGPPPAFSLERVEVRLEDGKPVELAAPLRPEARGEEAETSRVNHPVEWGSTTILVERAGIAPVLFVQDARGYAVDRVAVVTATERGAQAVVPIAGGPLRVEVTPVPLGPGFPERAALARARVRLRAVEGERELFAGSLAAGQTVAIGDRFLTLAEVRYWAGLRIVQERGGGLLVAGFLLAVIGLVWRLVWFRREVAIAWGGGRLRVAARGEFFPARVREEQELVARFLAEAGVKEERPG